MEIKPVASIRHVVERSAQNVKFPDLENMDRPALLKALEQSSDPILRLALLEAILSTHILAARPTRDQSRLNSARADDQHGMRNTKVTDAINQSPQHAHGRAWHREAEFWHDDAIHDLGSWRIEMEMNPLNTAVAQRFVPTKEDIAEALFRDDLEPHDFARLILQDDGAANKVKRKFEPEASVWLVGMIFLIFIAIVLVL